MQDLLECRLGCLLLSKVRRAAGGRCNLLVPTTFVEMLLDPVSPDTCGRALSLSHATRDQDAVQLGVDDSGMPPQAQEDLNSQGLEERIVA